MELRNVKTFISVAGLMSFRRAATVLNYAPSTVSAQIQVLEEELQLKLFDRLEKGIRLTEAGVRFLPYAMKLLELARDSISAAAGKLVPKGILTIRIPETLAAYRFPALLPQFLQEYPTVGLRIKGSSTHDVQRYLEAGLDLAFLVGETRPAENCFIEKIGNEELVLAGNVADWGPGSVRIEASDLGGRAMLCASSDSSGRVVMERFLNQRGLQGNVWIDFSSLTALKNSLYTLSGGCALLPRVALRQELESGALSELILQGFPGELPVYMLWYREKWMSPSLTFFMELFRNAWQEAVSREKPPPVVT